MIQYYIITEFQDETFNSTHQSLYYLTTQFILQQHQNIEPNFATFIPH